MRASTAWLFGLLLGIADAATCPYGYDGAAGAATSSSPGARARARARAPRHAAAAAVEARQQQQTGASGVMLMNRLAPSTSQLYIANADGSNERLLLGAQSAFEYHASFSPDGQYVAFTSERNGDGNSDVYMAAVNGSGPLIPIATTSAVEDAVSLSPNGQYAAYASTRDVYTSNIWITDLSTNETRSLTNQTGITGDYNSPNGFFAPSWSPDGQWIVFSSDRNTGWTGHDHGSGWEHTQLLSVYAIKPDGSGFREVYSDPQWSTGSPKFSPDGSRVVFYRMTLQNTWNARVNFLVADSEGQIASVDFATGTDLTLHTSGGGTKIYPQYLSADNIGYLTKGGDAEGLHYTGSFASVSGSVRSPAWSPDGQQVVYERQDYAIRALRKQLYSFDPDWDYQFTDVFPDLSLQGKLTYTSKYTPNNPGNASVMVVDASGQDSVDLFESTATGQISAGTVASGNAGLFQPAWSADGEWIAFGLGNWFQSRQSLPGWIYRVATNGSGVYEQLTNTAANAGYPSFSPDGSQIVFRLWGAEFGLRLLDLASGQLTTLTEERDNLPHWSPDGSSILFTRNVTDAATGQFSDYQIMTIKPDGSSLTALTTSRANDAHAVWNADGRVLWSSGMWGFQAEAATYDDTFQPYGQIMSMNSDGTNQQLLTNSMWEDSMPVFLPNSILGGPYEQR